jgi:hypothetical protein
MNLSNQTIIGLDIGGTKTAVVEGSALGSLAVALGDRVLAPARRALAEEALPQAVAACEVIPAKLGNRIGDVAALMAALTNNKNVGAGFPRPRP